MHIHSNTASCGGSVWSGYAPEEDEDDDGPWDWARTSIRHAALVYKPSLRIEEARELVQLEWRIGRQIRKLYTIDCDPPIIDDDPHPDGPPPENIYYRGAA